MVQEISPEDKAVVERLMQGGWTITPPEDSTWIPAFKPWFYEAGGDEEGQVYIRLDLPEGHYYGFQDAALLGLETLKTRLTKFQKIERDVKDLERNTPAHKKVIQRTIGVMDGVELSSMELRGMISFLQDQVSRWQKALDRADTRKHKP